MMQAFRFPMGWRDCLTETQKAVAYGVVAFVRFFGGPGGKP